ncbi:MAG: alpha/beta hydrolase, partial [Proteobacteria bacterium]|nr:alpha/beta hydrolase [Pseudomonadota bacterium]
MSMQSRLIDVPGPRGNKLNIRVYQGGKGPDLLFQHGAGGLVLNDPFLQRLCEHFTVHAPLLPGYEDSEGGEELRNMLDFTLHAFDVWDVLKLTNPLVVGHSMGGMIAAEMAAVAPTRIDRLALLCPAGLWLDDDPIADLFTALPFELPGLLFHDPEKNADLLSAGGDLNDPEFLTEFMVGNARRLGMAGKLLFPIPDRGLGDRLYRIQARTQLIWGASDRLIPPVYGPAFVAEIPNAD